VDRTKETVSTTSWMQSWLHRASCSKNRSPIYSTYWTKNRC
jgi:hypothetical protein